MQRKTMVKLGVLKSMLGHTYKGESLWKRATLWNATLALVRCQKQSAPYGQTAAGA